MSVLVDGQAAGDGDGAFAQGGHFVFYPAGSEDGDTGYQMSEHAARIIMGDPSMASHFECTPELDAQPEHVEDAQDAPAKRRRGKAGSGDEGAT